MNEIFEPYDVECNTCRHYDPMNGICQITGKYQHGYDDCNAIDNDYEKMWEEWDGEME